MVLLIGLLPILLLSKVNNPTKGVDCHPKSTLKAAFA
jgi:hypothetical protein